MLATTTLVQSGIWDDPANWSAGVPDGFDRALIPNGLTATLTGTDHVAKEIVVQGNLVVAESPGVTKTLTSDWIHVNSGGVFQIGTASDRYDENAFVLTLTGTDPTETFVIEGVGTVTDNNGFLMVASGGRLQFFGEEKLTFTKLAATAEAGANQILVEAAIDRDHDGDIDAADGSVNWEIGDQIVIASSTSDYDDEEVRNVTGIADQGNGTFLITLDAPLARRHFGEIETYGPEFNPGDFNNDGTVDAADYTVWRDGGGDQDGFNTWVNHYGQTAEPVDTWEIDMRAEVAVLNRNIRIQGLASQDTDNAFGDRARFNAGLSDGFGAHTMIMASAGQITIDSVQFDRMGQTARLGRYPIHWHVAGDRSGDVLRGASITNSNNRGVTVHGTHNLLIEGVVLHDVHGHGFFMEDAVETGNTFLANIAFGIHKVGRSAAVGNFAPDPNDPFIVDTHDFVGQNANRFLSSAAYWITNPDNTWIGNVSAGSEGTGFWFIFPERAIGLSSLDPQYNGVRPDRTNLRQFDHNASHSSPVGLNFDRGSDLEGDVGDPIKAFFDGDLWLPTVEPQINYYTAYQHRVGLYHRGFVANFHQNRYADNFTSTFVTFTQRITDTLYVGNSRGNANLGSPVTGHTIYDGASTLTGNHFAGFSASNAHTFRTHSAANRFTSHQVSDTSFEDDGTANSVSIAAQEGTLNGGTFGSHSPFKHSPSSIYDVDGTLTGHVGGGPGYTVVTDHPFFYDAQDIRPAGWTAVVSDDLYAQIRVQPTSGNPAFRFTSPDGDSGTERDSNGFNTHVKTNNGDYSVSFPDGVGSVTGGFNIKHYQRLGVNTGSTVIRFVGIGNTMAPQGVPELGSENAVRNASATSFARVGGDLLVKFFSSSQDVPFRYAPVSSSSETLWQDDSPLSGLSFTNGLSVNSVDGGAATGDAGRGVVGQAVLLGGNQYVNITPGGLQIDSQYAGTGFVFSADYFVPNGTTLTGGGSPDVFYLQLDVNGVNTFAGGYTSSSAAGSGWQTFSISGTLPGNTVEVQPYFIINDGGFNGGSPNGNGSGTALYVDNLNLTVGLASSTTLALATETSEQGATVDVALLSPPQPIPAASPSTKKPDTTPLYDHRAKELLLRDQAFAALQDEDEDAFELHAAGDGSESGALSPLPLALLDR